MESATESRAQLHRRKIRRRWILGGIAAIALVVVVAFGRIVDRVPVADEYENRLLTALNDTRVEAGLTPVTLNECVSQEAAAAAEVYESSLRVETFVTEVPCEGATVIGELAIRGRNSPEYAVENWQRSSYRRDIAFSADADQVGLGCRTYEIDIDRYVTCSIVVVDSATS
ncbi:CAP domain-containing protein [Demequina zhanjiangensis]